MEKYTDYRKYEVGSLKDIILDGNREVARKGNIAMKRGNKLDEVWLRLFQIYGICVIN